MPKKATIKDIAKEAGVSVALVSFVMNNRVGADGKQKYRVGEATRQRILDVAARMHYGPMNRIAQQEQKQRLVGVLLPDPSLPYYGRFALKLERLALPQGGTLLFGYYLGDPVRFERLAGSLLDRKIDGLVVVPPAEENDLMEEIARRGIPCAVPDTGEEAESSALACAERLFRLIEEQENLINHPLSL